MSGSGTRSWPRREGNPLALLELPRGLTPGGAGGRVRAARCGAAARSGSRRASRRQLEALPAQTRRLMLLAAAEPSGDPSLVWRAAGRLGIPVQAAAPAVEAGLVEFGARVRFRHPLLRSAAYRSASVADRQAVHGALAEVTDPRRRSGAPGLAPGPGRGRAGRGGRGGAGAVGGPGAGPRRAGRGGGVPGARGAADRRSGAPGRPHAGRGAGPACRPARSARPWSCSRMAEDKGPRRWMSCRAPGRTCCAGRSCSPRAWAATLRRCCSRRPSGSSRSTPAWPARPT